MELTESADLNFFSGQNVSLYGIFKYVWNIVIESPQVTIIYLAKQYANRKKKKYCTEKQTALRLKYSYCLWEDNHVLTQIYNRKWRTTASTLIAGEN